MLQRGRQVTLAADGFPFMLCDRVWASHADSRRFPIQTRSRSNENVVDARLVWDLAKRQRFRTVFTGNRLLSAEYGKGCLPIWKEDCCQLKATKISSICLRSIILLRKSRLLSAKKGTSLQLHCIALSLCNPANTTWQHLSYLPRRETRRL